MKHLAKFAAMALALSLWSCSDDHLPGSGQDEDGVYATITLHLPTGSGSRSTTVDPGGENPNGINNDNDDNTPNVPAQSSDGFEQGRTEENTVQDVLVVIAATDDVEKPTTFTYVAHAYTNKTQNVSETQPEYLLKFDAGNLKDYASENLLVFAYCNPEASFVDELNSQGAFGIDAIKEMTAGELPADPTSDAPNTPIRNDLSISNDFLMTNALITPVKMPDSFDAYNKDNPISLGTVYVERMACRFDFKRYTPENGTIDTYPVEFRGKSLLSVKLIGMALFNESKTSYYLPRMSPTGLNAEISLCGYETPQNWVVSTNASVKQGYNGNTDVSDLFFYPSVGVAPENFDYTLVTEPSLDDKHDSTYGGKWLWAKNEAPYDGYKIWRYASENTIPSVANQRNGISTGIWFKTELVAPDDAPTEAPALALYKAMKINKEPFYVYSDALVTDGKQGNSTNISEILGTLGNLYSYCSEHSHGVLAGNFLLACQDGTFTVMNGTTTVTVPKGDDIDQATLASVVFATGNTVVLNDNTTNANLNRRGFYCYKPDADGKYYSYYPYYNRHDDNGQPYKMGQMEFAAVRNNVYKIQVTNINRIGLPGDVPPDPGTPDESEDIYMHVSVRILDWVVRINDVVF